MYVCMNLKQTLQCFSNRDQYSGLSHISGKMVGNS